MEDRKTEYITLHLIIFGTIVIIGVFSTSKPHFTMVGTSSAATLFLWYVPLSWVLSISIYK